MQRIKIMRCTWQPVFLLIVKTLFHLFQHLIDAEAGRLHARWEFLESFQELPDQKLRRIGQVDAVNQPIPVGVRGNVRSFEWVSTQVEHLGYAQEDKRFCPDQDCALDTLLGKDKLPIVIAQPHQIAIIGEVDDALARSLFHLAGEVRQEILPVNMHLEGLVASLVSLL